VALFLIQIHFAFADGDHFAVLGFRDDESVENALAVF
jgi:hypothetical protein